MRPLVMAAVVLVVVLSGCGGEKDGGGGYATAPPASDAAIAVEVGPMEQPATFEAPIADGQP